jgi:hypothetical protein
MRQIGYVCKKTRHVTKKKTAFPNVSKGDVENFEL